MSERIVTFQTPVAVTQAVSVGQVSVPRVIVETEAKELYALIVVGGVPRATLLCQGDAYDASGVTNFWPVVEGLIKAKAAAGTLF